MDLDDENPEEWTAGMTGLARRVIGDDGQVQLEISPCFVTLPEVDDREVKIKTAGFTALNPLNSTWHGLNRARATELSQILEL